MRLFRNAALLLGLSAGVGLLSIQSSKAADWDTCGVAGAGSAMGLFSTFPTESGCLIGDKLLTLPSTNVTSPVQIMFSEVAGAPDQHSVVFQNAAGLTPGSFFNYTLAVSGSPEKIEGYSLDTAGSGFGATYSVTSTTSAGGSLIGSKPGASGAGPFFFGTPVTTLEVSNNWTQGSPGLQQVTNTFKQTPGPLPILGAGAAFGFTRKLRKRIKSVA